MRATVAAIVLLGALTHIAAAQRPVPPRLSAAASTLRKDVRVRLSSGGQRTLGTFESATGEHIVIATGNESQPFELATLDTLWERRQPIVRDALTGGLILGIVGVALGYAVQREACAVTSVCVTRNEVALRGFAIGVSAGVVVGAFTGAMGHWKRRFP